MNHIFISHAREDAQWAQRLCEGLRNVGHEVRVDIDELRLGDSVIDFMNDGIGAAGVVIILHSRHTVDAKWQRVEVESATWLEIERRNIRLIVLTLDAAPLPPLLGRKVFAELNDTTYRPVLDKLCQSLLPRESSSSVVSAAFQEGSPNPFWRLRAEYFDEIPKQLAAAYSEPSSDKIGAFHEMRPSIVEGSRGTGKTMLLMSLRARNLLARQDTPTTIKELFGFYLRLTRGAFCNAGVLAAPTGRLDVTDGVTLLQITTTFSQEFFVSLVESLLSEILYCVKERALTLDLEGEKRLVAGLLPSLALAGSHQGKPTSLVALLDHCGLIHRRIADFTKRRFIYDEVVTAPIASLDLDTFKSMLKHVKAMIPELCRSQMTVLLDEYENLFDHQRIVANDIIKLGPPDFSVRVAKKVGTADTSDTLSGQELQEIHDYRLVSLVYPVDDSVDLQSYCRLLGRIAENALRSDGLGSESPDALLPRSVVPEVPVADLRQEVIEMTGADRWAALSEKEREERLAYYSTAATYRLVYGRSGGGRQRQFAGFRELAFLSSGVIRYFQEILGIAYYLQFGAHRPAGTVVAIEPQHQSRAAHLVSEHNLASLSRNVEKQGERLKYLLLDLGDILRMKLLRHPTEPEAGRLALADAEKLGSSKYDEVRLFLTLAEREGVFQTPSGRPGMRPKHPSDPQPVEFHISRIFCPVLQFSPRLRWKTLVTADDLLGLLSAETRRATKKRLVERVAPRNPPSKQAKLPLEEGGP